MTTTNKPRRMARSPEADTDAALPPTKTASFNASPAPKRANKHDLVLEMLQREGGVLLSAIVAATGWLPHTVRAVLTGLRKKGHNVARSISNGETCYSVTAATKL